MDDQTPPPYGPPSVSPYGSAYPQAFPPPGGDARQTDGLALGSLITGISSLVLCGLGALIGPVAVILGIVSRRRSRADSKAVWGIVLGAVGTALSLLAIVSAIITFTQQRDSALQSEQAEATSSAQSAGDAQGTAAPQPDGVALTEAGIAASRYDTAYAAYRDLYGVSQSFDGMYAGGPIDTPCFTLEGEAWWVVQGDPESCEPSSELWWETFSDTPATEIKLFGSGAAGSAISFEALKTETLVTKFGSTDLQPVADYARDTLLADAGATDVVETSTELGGLPATQFDCTIGPMAAYRLDVVMLPAPMTLSDGTEISGFIIHAYNEAEWVYSSEDVFARLDRTLVWK